MLPYSIQPEFMIFKLILYAITLVVSISISNAHVTLDSPKGRDYYQPEDEIKIKWTEAQDHGENNWDLYFSLDGGDSWETIELDIDENIYEYTWEIPSSETATAKIRIVQDNKTGTDYDDISGNFTISNEPSEGGEIITALFESNTNSTEKTNLTNFPNPFSSQTTIHFSLTQTSQVQLYVHNLHGEIISALFDSILDEGSYDIPWKNTGFSEGIYLCKLSIDGQIITRKIVVGR